MEIAGNEKIEQLCMAVSLRMTQRAVFYSRGQTDEGDKANLIIERLIEELREKMK